MSSKINHVSLLYDHDKSITKYLFVHGLARGVAKSALMNPFPLKPFPTALHIPPRKE